MTKRNKIIYWIATVWLSLGMVSSGIIQLMQADMEIELMNHLGYPLYLLTWLGVWKILGTIAILAPKYPRLKEWAYAGMFLTMSGGAFSHLAAGDPVSQAVPAIMLTILTLISWYFRPANRKLV